MRKTLTICMLLVAFVALAQQKREFRGAWIQCVNGPFKGVGTETMQRTLTYQLDELQKDGCNAIIFQVRPECDALYESDLEPWSYYLTGRQGEKPTPYWDPLQWMIDECHRRGMELHAWINPYRAKMDIALCKGKKVFDKRQTLKEKEDRREMDRVMKNARGL